MKVIVCWIKGHIVVQVHYYEPLAQFHCTRCRRRFFDPRMDAAYQGYCARHFRLMSEYGIGPMQLASADQIKRLVANGDLKLFTTP